MANDAEIKLVLDTKEAIQEAKAFGPKLEKMLNIKVNNQGFTKLQDGLKDTLRTAGLLSEKTNEAGETIATLAKGFRTDGLKDYESKLTDIFKTVDAITENEKNLAEVQKQIATLGGNEKGKSVKSLQGTYAATKDPIKKEKAKADWEKAKQQLIDAETEETKLLARQQELNATFDAQYKKVSYVCDAMNKVSTASSKTKANVEVMEDIYKDLNASVNNTANKEETAADSAEKLGTHTKEVADTATDADAAIGKVTGDLENAANAADNLKHKVAEANGEINDSATSAGKASATTDRVNEIKETLKEIYRLKSLGQDTSEQITKLGQILDTELGSKDRFDLTQLFLDTDEAIKYVKKDLTMSDVLRDEFNSIGDFFEQIRKKLNELNAEARKAGEPVVDAATEIEQNIQKINGTVIKIPTMRFDNDFDARKNIDELKTAMKSIVDMGMPIQLKDQYNLLKKAIDDSKEAQKSFNETANKPTAEQRLNELRNTVAQVTSTTTSIDEAMKTQSATDNIAELIRRLNELNVAKKKLEELNLPKDADATYNRIIQLIAILNAQISEYKKKLTDTSKEHEKTKKTGTNFVKSLLSAFKTLKGSMSTINRTTGKVKSSFDSMASSMKSNFKHMITNITKYVLGFRSLFFLVRRLRKYVGEGIQNLAKFNDGNNIVNESITDMLSSLLYLKNAWAAAFSPIITYVRPILVSLIDSLADVGNAIARFLSALFGQEIAFNAVRVRAQDYADSLDNAGGSASGAADKVKKLTDRLAAFDDLNVLGVDNDPDGTGSGGGGGIADEYIPDPNEMFKIVDPEQNGLLAMLKKAWETADFSPVGEAIKVKLIGVFRNIKWEDIKDKAGRFGTGAGSFVAGLFGDPKLFEEAGKTIGEGLNTVTTAISNFLDETEGVDFGGNLAKGFNEFLKTTDWETMGENISRTFTQVTDNINSFLDTLDDEELEKSIHDFIMKLDLPKLLADAGKTAIKLLGKLTIITVDIVKALGESLGDNLILYAQAKVQVTQLTQQGYDENGRPIEMPVYIEPEYDWTEHPFKALIEKILTDIGSFGVDVLFNVEGEEDLQKLIDLWLPIFGDNGDFFRVMDVIAGVIQGNPGKWITGVFGDNKDLEDLRTALDAIITIIRPLDAFAIADMFRDVDFGQLKDDIEKDFEDFSWGDLFGSIFGSSDLDDDGSSGKIGMVKDSWNSLGETSEKTYNKVKGDFQLLDTDLSDIWTTIQTTAETTATTLYDNLTTKWGEIKGSAYEKFVGVKTNITDKLQEAKDSAEEKIETLKTNLTNKWQEIKGNIYEKLVGIKTNVLTVFDQLKEAIKTPINGFLSIIESMVNKVIYGINLLTSALNSLPDVKMTNPFTGTEYALGFTISPLDYVEIPRLAQGAVIPPNREFMAVLGDQSHGTNIEAPLDTIKQAVAEVIANNGNEEVINLLQQLITVVESKNLVIGDKEIGKANARYVNQQKLIRGTSI